MHRWHIIQACDAVLSGGIIAYPTEAVYGLGCLPANEAAVDRLLRLKHRSPRKKGLIIIASTIDQILSFIETRELKNLDEIFNTWPGPVTWVFPANRILPRWLIGENNSIAVRVSANEVVCSLCEKVGPLISTSANRNGLQPARSSRQVRNYFFNEVDYIYPGNLGSHGMPTEIRNAINGQILRKSTPIQ